MRDMSKDKLVQMLRCDVTAWNRMRHQTEGLSKVDLSGVDLAEANMGGADLTFVDLRHANLVFADLTQADLSNAVLNEANLRDANLTGAKLDSADLHFALLANTNLSEANLTFANFSSANLTDANLRGSNLREATLFGTNLDFATLADADLTSADLSHARLFSTRLNDADLTMATMASTTIGNTDLSCANGIESIRHRGPSELTISTLLQFERLPEIFLRGCGLPDYLIDYVPSLRNSQSAIEFYSCFISYNQTDKRFARRLHDALQGRGIRCWLDEKQILLGEDLYAKIDEGLKVYDKVLLCASENSLKSWWVERELDRAFEREKKLQQERGESVLSIIPLDLDRFLLDEWDHPHAHVLRKRCAADFTKELEGDYDEKFEIQIERLVQALRADPGRKASPPPSKL